MLPCLANDCHMRMTHIQQKVEHGCIDIAFQCFEDAFIGTIAYCV